MATPATFTDATTTFTAANMNKFLTAGDANKASCKAWWARIRYTGSAWEVVSTTDKAGLASGALAWSGADDQLVVTLSGFTAPPVVLATPIADDDAYTPRAHATASTSVVVAFFDAAGARVTTEDSEMDCQLMIVGV